MPLILASTMRDNSKRDEPEAKGGTIRDTADDKIVVVDKLVDLLLLVVVFVVAVLFY